MALLCQLQYPNHACSFVSCPTVELPRSPPRPPLRRALHIVIPRHVFSCSITAVMLLQRLHAALGTKGSTSLPCLLPTAARGPAACSATCLRHKEAAHCAIAIIRRRRLCRAVETETDGSEAPLAASSGACLLSTFGGRVQQQCILQSIVEPPAMHALNSCGRSLLVR
jgi:hypothetical protein